MTATFDAPPEEITDFPHNWRDRFADYHEAHPEVFTWLENAVARLVEAGVERYDMSTLLGRCRWEARITTGERPAINQNYARYYRQMLLCEHPEWADMFRSKAAA